ncbi:hypothetical protein RHSIM_Rhsim08G0029400 [Rhododendron simsii]|uniref:Uncharacterized protein n=1 Tax=Rhododendron simsii TaxID=118357 RepID=A0A834GL01_RHOSS|nr:hypothetical protein RHSIM_Rhsim08G0029400 [Rhododendron simsii]
MQYPTSEELRTSGKSSSKPLIWVATRLLAESGRITIARLDLSCCKLLKNLHISVVKKLTKADVHDYADNFQFGRSEKYFDSSTMSREAFEAIGTIISEAPDIGTKFAKERTTVVMASGRVEEACLEAAAGIGDGFVEGEQRHQKGRTAVVMASRRVDKRGVDRKKEVEGKLSGVFDK